MESKMGNETKRNLILLERYVLEILAREKMVLQDLFREVGFPPNVLNTILQGLSEQGLIVIKDQNVSLNIEERDMWEKTINSLENKKMEVLDIVESVLNLYLDPAKRNDRIGMKLKKVWMSEEEFNIFKSLLYRIEEYLDVIAKEGKKCEKRKGFAEKHLIFWGNAQYLPLIQDGLGMI